MCVEAVEELMEMDEAEGHGADGDRSCDDSPVPEPLYKVKRGRPKAVATKDKQASKPAEKGAAAKKKVISRAKNGKKWCHACDGTKCTSCFAQGSAQCGECRQPV